MTEFSGRMRALTEATGLSVRECARRACVSPGHYSNLMNGRARPPLPDSARQIDRALNAGGELVALAARERQAQSDDASLPIASSADGPMQAEDVTDVYNTIAQLITLDRQYGAGGLVDVGVRALRGAQDKLAVGTTSGLIADARRAVAELAEVCGWLAYDEDRQDLSRRMFSEAQLTAELAGDWQMEAFVRDLRAMQDLHVGRPEDALLVARRAVDDPRVNGRMEAIFHLRQGRAYAELGNTAQALDALARSRSVLAEGMRSTDSLWTWWIHEGEVCLHESLAHSALGLHREAAELSQRSVELLPAEQVRDRAVYLTYRMKVLTAAGAWDDAVQVARELTRLWPTVRSPRTANLLMDAVAVPQAPARVVEAAHACLAVTPT